MGRHEAGWGVPEGGVEELVGGELAAGLAREQARVREMGGAGPRPPRVNNERDAIVDIGHLCVMRKVGCIGSPEGHTHNPQPSARLKIATS